MDSGGATAVRTPYFLVFACPYRSPCQILSQMGPIVNSLSPATQRDIMGILQRDEEWKTLHTTIASLQEETEKLKSENFGMVGRLEAVATPREPFRSQVSSLKEVGTTRQGDIESLRAELVKSEHKYDRLVAHSNAERAALQIRISDLEVGSGSYLIVD